MLASQVSVLTGKYGALNCSERYSLRAAWFYPGPKKLMVQPARNAEWDNAGAGIANQHLITDAHLDA
jgi:hypothetical protein